MQCGCTDALLSTTAVTAPVASGDSFYSDTVRFETLHVPAICGTRTRAWHDAFPIAQGRFVVVMGDVHGSAAHAAALVHNVRAVFERPLAGALGRAAEIVLRNTATTTRALIGIVDVENRTLTYVCINHRPPVVRYQDGTVAVLPTDVEPGGLLEADRPQAQVSVNLGQAAQIWLLSNALVPLPAGDDGIGHGLTPTTWLSQRVVTDKHADVALLALRLPLRAPATAPAEHAAVQLAGARPGWSVSWSFDATGPSSNGARRAFLAYLCAKQHAAAAVDLAAAELVFGELLGNVVRHAPGEVEITLDWSDELPVLHVLDNGPGFQSRRARERLPADDLSECGRGLFIVNACAAQFTIRNRAGRGTHACVILPAA